ncbi:MAG: YihY/virulence factor BrkB family protein [Candidatus Krumholzibacteriota bacterium]|nr:YihY/virulence factor BrkB family protein [Candidatus Krumholzibacteriota bacterium]
MTFRSIRSYSSLFKDAGRGWARDDVPSMAAALAFHAVLSLAPLLIILVGVISILFGNDAVENEIVTQLHESIGEKASIAVQTVIRSTHESRAANIAAGSGSLLLLVIFASGVFQQLIISLNRIWGKNPSRKHGVSKMIIWTIRRHLFAFLMVVCLGVWLYASILFGALTVIPEKLLLESFPEVAGFLPRIPMLLSPFVLTFLLAILFKVIPNLKIDWSDVWFGAAFTSVLFLISERLIEVYLQRTIVTSLYGAAGSLVILLLWVYWSAMVFLFGAELARAYAERFGSRKDLAVTPEKG